MQNCPICNNYLGGGTYCSRCCKDVSGGLVKQVELDGVTAAIRAQADSAANMLAALTYAHALPLTSLLQSWWEKLPVAEMDAFVKALAKRCCELIENGILDDELKRRIREVMKPDVVAAHVKKTIESQGDPHIMAIAAKLLDEGTRDGYGRQSDFHGYIVKGIGEAVQQVAREHSMGSREVIEAAVRDAMPSIEEMTKKVVSDVANDMAANVRKSMERK